MSYLHVQFLGVVLLSSQILIVMECMAGGAHLLPTRSSSSGAFVSAGCSPSWDRKCYRSSTESVTESFTAYIQKVIQLGLRMRHLTSCCSVRNESLLSACTSVYSCFPTYALFLLLCVPSCCFMDTVHSLSCYIYSAHVQRPGRKSQDLMP